MQFLPPVSTMAWLLHSANIYKNVPAAATAKLWDYTDAAGSEIIYEKVYHTQGEKNEKNAGFSHKPTYQDQDAEEDIIHQVKPKLRKLREGIALCSTGAGREPCRCHKQSQNRAGWPRCWTVGHSWLATVLDSGAEAVLRVGSAGCGLRTPKAWRDSDSGEPSGAAVKVQHGCEGVHRASR